MAKLRGVTGEVYNGATKVAGLSDITLSVELGDADASDHDSGGWGESMTTTAKWSATLNGRYIDGNATQQALIDAAPLGTTITFHFRPNGTGSSKTEFTGDGRVKSYEQGQPQDGVQSLNFSVVGVGPLTRGTQA